MARKVDDLGRIVLPVEMRRLFRIRAGDALDISVDDRGIMLRKVETRCVFCDGLDTVRAFHGKQLCGACAVELGAGATPEISEVEAEPDTSRAHFFEVLPTAAEFAEQLPPPRITPTTAEIEQALAGEVETVSTPPEVQSDVVDPPAWES